jgi:hypothetical protein
VRGRALTLAGCTRFPKGPIAQSRRQFTDHMSACQVLINGKPKWVSIALDGKIMVMNPDRQSTSGFVFAEEGVHKGGRCAYRFRLTAR